jgi:uncharacterized protein (DUF2252 family)
VIWESLYPILGSIRPHGLTSDGSYSSAGVGTVRYERMLANPFAFLRGAAAVMAEDLRHEPTAGIPVQACGDCRTSGHSLHRNRTSCSTSIISTRLSGVDFTADLKRLAASVAVAALAANLSKKQARAIAATTVEAYRAHLRSLARRSPLEI